MKTTLPNFILHIVKQNLPTCQRLGCSLKKKYFLPKTQLFYKNSLCFNKMNVL